MSWKDKLKPVGEGGGTATTAAPSATATGYKAKLQPVTSESSSQAPAADAPKKSFLDSILGGAQKVSDFFGGKGISDLLGTTIAKATVPEDQKQYVSQGPTDKEVLGSALQIGSLMIPVGRLATGVGALARTAKIGEKAAEIGGKVIAGGTAGAAYDVGSGLQGNDTGGAGTIIGSTLPLVPPVLKAASKLVPKGPAAQTAEEVAGRVVQGNQRAAKIASEALPEVNTKGVKTYEDLGKRLADSIDEKAQIVEGEFANSTVPVKLSKLTQTMESESGSVKGKINYVRDALSQLSDLYKRTKDLPGQLKIKELMDKAKKVGLTPGEINQLAKDYGAEFKAKGFSKIGQALTNISDQAYENTRKGLKEVARSFLESDTAKAADKAMSKLLTTQKLVKTMTEKVSALEQRIKQRGLLEQVGRLIGTGVDLASGGAVRGFISKFFPSQVGLKVMNSMDLEKELAKNLKLLDRLSKSPDTEFFNFLKYIYDPKNSALPGDVLLRNFFKK